jgi:hypothetical protein
LVAKRLELLHALVPKATIIAVLLDTTRETQLEDVEAAARAVGRQVVIARAAARLMLRRGVAVWRFVLYFEMPTTGQVI